MRIPFRVFVIPATVVCATLSMQEPCSAQPAGVDRADAGAEPKRSRFASIPDLPAYIDNLKAAKDRETAKTLLAIAMDKDVSEYHADAAAHAFTASLPNKMDAAELLGSPKQSVREIGFVAMNRALGILGANRKPIDGTTWDNKLLPLLQSGTVRDREWVLGLARNARGGVLPREKAAALIRGMVGLESVPGSRGIVGWDHWTGPHYQMVYRDLVCALAEMEGVTVEDLRELMPTEEGPVRDCVLIARFTKHDASVRAEVATMALGHPQYPLKVQAVRAFMARGTRQDIPLLEEVARTDSLSKTSKSPPSGSSVTYTNWKPQVIYPLREEARYGITNILRRTAE